MHVDEAQIDGGDTEAVTASIDFLHIVFLFSKVEQKQKIYLGSLLRL